MYTTQNVRGEHLLWLTPILYICLTSINAPIQNFIVFNEGNFYLFNFSLALVIFLLIIALPFYIHIYLRKQDLRNIVISWVHIVPTLLIILAIISIYAYAPPIEISWKNAPLSNPFFLQWQIYNKVATTLFEVLIVIQTIYIIYGLSKINQLRIEQYRNNVSEFDPYSFEESEVMIHPSYKYTWIPKPAEPIN